MLIETNEIFPGMQFGPEEIQENFKKITNSLISLGGGER